MERAVELMLRKLESKATKERHDRPVRSSNHNPAVSASLEPATVHPKGSRLIPAADRVVLTTTELLEIILLELPSATTFVVQRVCKKWREVISDSSKIRRKLFLEPSQPPVRPGRLMNPEQDPNVFERVMTEMERMSPWVTKTTFPNEIYVKLNPFLTFLRKEKESECWPDFGTAPASLGISFLEEVIYKRTPGTWREMQLTDPQSLAVVGHAECTYLIEFPRMHWQSHEDWKKMSPGYSKIEATRVVGTPTGVTLGLVLDALWRLERGGISTSRGVMTSMSHGSLEEEITCEVEREIAPDGMEEFVGECSVTFQFLEDGWL